MTAAALEGLRVVELGQRVSAPYCGKLFADFGAEVIKVEAPAGDTARSWGPFPGDVPHREKSGLFFFLNTNKRGICLDLTAERGRTLLLELLARADLFVENQQPGELRRLGLDYDSLRAVNPKLVMISITPFGQTGPYSEWKGYDLNAFHLTAAGSRYCGRPGEPPLEQGTFAADFYGAAAAAAWGMAALLGLSRAGGGQHLDVSSAEAIAATFVGGQNIGGYAQDGVFDLRTGVGMSLGAPATILPCKDGHVWILALETAQWKGLTRAMGSPEWARLEMFEDMFVRAQNADAIYPLIEQWTRERSKWEIMDRCQAEGCPVTAVFTVAEAAEHPHLAERSYRVAIEHSALGKVSDLAAPFSLPLSPGGPLRPAPLLGQHNEEVYCGLLGLDPSVLAELEQEGLIRPVPATATVLPASSAAPLSAGRAVAQQAVTTPDTPDCEGAEQPRAAAQGSVAGQQQATGQTQAAECEAAIQGEALALPLRGIRVANFGWVWAGPVVGQTLGFLGAEVYKIESRARVDLTRGLPPFAEGRRDPDRSLSNHACWAGNGSITLNLKKPEARRLARELVARCDVVVENFGPGVMDSLGLGYEQLRAVRPDLVMFSMPAAGLYGALRDVRTYGLSLSSITGLDSITGYHGGPPLPMENAFSDPYNGILGAFAILVALRHRARSGQGQHIDYSQQEAVMQMVGPALMDYIFNRRVAGPLGNRHPLGAGAPHGVFPCAGDDRWIAIAVLSDEEWSGLVEAMEHPPWSQSRGLASRKARIAQIDELHGHLAAWTRGFDDRELAWRLQRHGVAATPVLNVADLLDDPHYRARGTFIEVRHPLGFRETIYGAYVKTSRSRAVIRPGPSMGQDNERVFLDLLGLEEPVLRRLVTEQVIY